jgi:hypothetical protein
MPREETAVVIALRGKWVNPSCGSTNLKRRGGEIVRWRAGSRRETVYAAQVKGNEKELLRYARYNLVKHTFD